MNNRTTIVMLQVLLGIIESDFKNGSLTRDTCFDLLDLPAHNLCSDPEELKDIYTILNHIICLNSTYEIEDYLTNTLNDYKDEWDDE